MKKITSTLSLLGLVLTAYAQQPPRDQNAIQATRKWNAALITNVTAHLGTGQVIENAAVGYCNGYITVVTNMTNPTMRLDTFDRVINGLNLHLYPGFIAPNTRIGLEEIESVRATRDFVEVGNFNPHVRSLIAYNTDSEIIPTVRSNGILYAQVCPQGDAAITGTSSVMSLESYDNWEERAYRADEGVHLNWISSFQVTGWWAEPGEIKHNDKYGEGLKMIKTFFTAAKAYQETTHEQRNLRLEAMKGVFEGTQTLYVHTDEARGILDAIQLGKDFGIKKIVIVGGADAWMVADALHANNVPVILQSIHSLPVRNDDDIDQPYKTPKMLAEKGVLFSLSLNGSWQQRNLAFQAGQAAAYGLDPEAAVAAITLNTAKILGIDKTVGSIEVGKEATFLISKGDALDMENSVILNAFIKGNPVDLDDKQKELFRQYTRKFNLGQ